MPRGAVRAVEGEGAVRLAGHGEPALVHDGVVAWAQPRAVGHRCWSTIGEVANVGDVGGDMIGETGDLTLRCSSRLRSAGATREIGTVPLLSN